IVRSPTSTNRSLLNGLIALLRKVISGYVSTSKKSGDFKCPSRCSTPVLMLDASIATSTVPVLRSPFSVETVPVHRSNWPRTFATTICRTEKWIPEWLLSICQSSLIVLSRGVVVDLAVDLLRQSDGHRKVEAGQCFLVFRLAHILSF